MDISLDTLLKALDAPNAHIVSASSSSAHNAILNSAALWSKNEPVNKSTCYVVPSKQLHEIVSLPEQVTIAVIGEADEDSLRAAGMDALIIDVQAKKASFNAWFNRINRIFSEYYQWASMLTAALLHSPSLQDISAFGESFFGNPVLILDRNFCLLNKADPDIQIAWAFHQRTQDRMLPEEMISIIKVKSGHQSLNSGSHAFFISNDYLAYNIQFLHVNRGNAIFTLAVLEKNEPLRKLSIDALRYFADCVYTVLCQSSFHYGHSLRFEGFVKKLLSNEQIELAVIDQYLSLMNWRNRDNYICLTFEINCWDRASSAYHSICMNLESSFPQTFAFLYDDRIVAIVNLDKAQLTHDAMIQQLTFFLREHLLHVGVSYTFFDFSTVISYFKQSSAALEMGALYSPDIWCYRFEDYALPYFMHYGTTQINGRHLCHPGLVQLWIYDSLNKTMLLETLFEYLTTGLNATATAKHLFIHRNTFYQRLDKIVQIINADLNDPNTRLYMLMSYSFVDLLKLKPVQKAAPDSKPECPL